MIINTIHKKLVTTFLLIIIVPMCTTAIISNIILYNNLKGSYISSMEKSVSGINNVIDENYKGYEVALAQLSENSIAKAAVTNPNEALVKKELSGIIKSNPKILNVYVATENCSACLETRSSMCWVSM